MRESKLVSNDLIIEAGQQTRYCPTANWNDAQTFSLGGQLFHSLAVLFSDSEKMMKCDQYVTACGNAVFSMMPTMAKNKVDVEAFRNFSAARIFADLSPFVHGSWSATSKFLYFWDKASYAIWDSRVRKALNKNLRHGTKLGSMSGEQYGAYVSALKTLADDDALQAHIASKFHPEMSACPFFQGMRRIETALYVIGVPSKSTARK